MELPGGGRINYAFTRVDPNREHCVRWKAGRELASEMPYSWEISAAV